MITSKTRKHSGRITPKSTLLHEMSIKDIIRECLEPIEVWDDWLDYRDGFRDVRDKTKIYSIHSRFGDRKKLNIELSNTKNKKLLKIRKARKNGKVY